MNIGELGGFAERYGLGVVLSLVIVMILWFLLKAIMNQWREALDREKEVLLQAAKEREGWQQVMQSFLTKFEEHSVDARNRYKGLEEANRYQREEHIKLIEGLNKLCMRAEVMGNSLENTIATFKDAHLARSYENKGILENVQTLCTQCIENGRMLARMNGKTA